MPQKIKILVVEDEPAVAAFMTFLLTRDGYDVDVAFNGRTAMEMTAHKTFDLITLDVDLPDMSGFEICRELKRQKLASNTPVIFVSGNEESRDKSFEFGAIDFIPKPFDVAHLLSRIRCCVLEKLEMKPAPLFAEQA